MHLKNDYQEKDFLLAEVNEPSPPYGKIYTYGNYLKFDFEYMVELIRGKIYKMSPSPSKIHQIILGNFHALF